MKKFLQAVPALLATVSLLALAAGLFVPRDRWPEPLGERLPLRHADQPAAAAPAIAAQASPAETKSPLETEASPPLPAFNSIANQKSGSVAATSFPTAAKSRPETEAELMNCLFLEAPGNSSHAPRAVEVILPEFPGRHAVWAGTGRDVQGRVWIGACVERGWMPSARLFCYESQTGELADHGDVATALLSHGLQRSGETQYKIHSKIIQAGDGHLYFASMDEHGENPDGSQNPTWGGHLWRLRMPESKWEHLHAAPQALIAVAGMGRYVYAIGYFGHVLLQYDTETGATQTVIVGSIDGHVSRNMLADLRGHAFVPRVTRNDGAITASLVEFDPSLKEIQSTPLEFYVGENPTDSHGITGIQPLADGSLAFVTHRGRLYHVISTNDGPAEVRDLGWMHPLGEAIIESLFTHDGKTSLLAVAALPSQEFEWVSFDLGSKISTVRPLEFPARYAGVNEGLLLYGSMTRDAEGAFYLVGTSMKQKPYGPVVWKLFPPK